MSIATKRRTWRFASFGENLAAAKWGPEEIAAALYELTDNHLTALRMNDMTDEDISKTTT